MKQIVAAVDFSDQHHLVIDYAIRMAKAFGASLQILHVVAPEPDFVGYAPFGYPGRDERADQLREEKLKLSEMADRGNEAGVETMAFMREAPTVEGLLKFAEEHHADLIVIGTHSKNLLARIVVGSSAQDMIKRSHIPVLVVPPALEKMK